MKYYTYEIFETVLNNFWISFKKTNKFYKISNEKTEDHISGYPDTRLPQYSWMYDRFVILRYTQKSLFTAVVADLKTRRSSSRAHYISVWKCVKWK